MARKTGWSLVAGAALIAVFIGPIAIAARLGLFAWTTPAAFVHSAMVMFGILGGIGYGLYIGNQVAKDAALFGKTNYLQLFGYPLWTLVAFPLAIVLNAALWWSVDLVLSGPESKMDGVGLAAFHLWALVCSMVAGLISFGWFRSRHPRR
jgi:hypothetical protein